MRKYIFVFVITLFVILLSSSAHHKKLVCKHEESIVSITYIDNEIERIIISNESSNKINSTLKSKLFTFNVKETRSYLENLNYKCK